jgi:murein DD-endopeptidase MepM/ murein hydrolase activator NlpD
MEPTKFKVNTQHDDLTIRKLPNGELAGLSAKKGSVVVVLEQKDGWSRIAEGWVSSKFLLKVDDVTVTAEPDTLLKFTHQPIIFPDPDHLILRTAGLATPEGAKFGMTRKDSKGKPKPHQGIDLEVPPGEPVFAVETGTIVDKRFSKDYGNVLCLSVSEGALKGKFFFYAHLNRMDVAIGDKVNAGDAIGLTGSTGNAKSMTTIRLGSHLHFEGRTVMQAGLGLGGRFDPLPLIRLK